MNMIVAADSNWAIGHKGRPLISIPADQKMMRAETTGKVVVYGRKTLDSFPGKQPLTQRTNIILSGNNDLTVKDASVVHSVEELLKELEKYDSDDIYIIGGESVYRQLLPYVDTVHVTKIDRSYDADAYFMDLDDDDAWEITAESDEQFYFDVTYEFIKYSRK